MSDETQDAVSPQEVADAGAVAEAVMDKLGPRLGGLVVEAVDHKIKELGLDRVDRKAGVFPGAADADESEPDPKKRVEGFLRSALFGPSSDVSAKALSESSSPAGGYLVPDGFRSEVVMRANELSVLYPLAFRFRTSLASVKVPSLATDVDVSWDEAENADFDETTPVFGQKSFSVHRMNAITYASRELLADSAVSLVDLLAQLFAEAVGRERDKVVCVGDGSDRPEGVFSATGVTTVSSIGSMTYDKLLEMDETIGEQYRGDPSLVWISNQTVRRYVRGLTDDNGRPLLEPALERGAPLRLLDHPYLVNSNAPSGYLALGVLGKYWIADREEMGFESTTTGGDTFKKHQLGLKVWERCDGKVVLAAAWAKGTGITG
jgi:HK97 family phage major capsid protein